MAGGEGELGGRGGVCWRGVCVCVGVGRLILFAFGTQTVQSMQIDQQWPFAVLFLSCNISVSAQSQHKKAGAGPPRCVALHLHLPGASVVLSRGPEKGPRPPATNHMKDAASLQIALLKGIFDV